MSNQEYEKQQAIQAQHRREVEKSVQATALAAQRAAESAERARQEQNASLQRQEELILTNNFRNTVLSALPLVQKDQQKQYVINQIKTRIKNIKTDGLHIEKHEFLKAIGMDTIVETEGLKIENEDCFKIMMKAATRLQQNLFPTNSLTDVLQYPTKHFNNKEKSIKSAITQRFLALLLVLLSHVLLVAFLTNQSTPLNPISGGTKVIMYFIFTCIPWIFLMNRVKNIDKVKNNINDEETLFQKRVEVKSKFMSLIQYQLKTIQQTETSAIAGMVFDNIVKNKINDEQSFIPPNALPSDDDWKENIFSKKTISIINTYLSDLEKDINEHTYIMGQEMVSLIKSKSSFYIAYGRIPQ